MRMHRHNGHCKKVSKRGRVFYARKPMHKHRMQSHATLNWGQTPKGYGYESLSEGSIGPDDIEMHLKEEDEIAKKGYSRTGSYIELPTYHDKHMTQFGKRKPKRFHQRGLEEQIDWHLKPSMSQKELYGEEYGEPSLKEVIPEIKQEVFESDWAGEPDVFMSGHKMEPVEVKRTFSFSRRHR